MIYYTSNKPLNIKTSHSTLQKAYNSCIKGKFLNDKFTIILWTFNEDNEKIIIVEYTSTANAYDIDWVEYRYIDDIKNDAIPPIRWFKIKKLLPDKYLNILDEFNEMQYIVFNNELELSCTNKLFFSIKNHLRESKEIYNMIIKKLTDKMNEITENLHDPDWFDIIDIITTIDYCNGAALFILNNDKSIKKNSDNFFDESKKILKQASYKKQMNVTISNMTKTFNSFLKDISIIKHNLDSIMTICYDISCILNEMKTLDQLSCIYLNICIYFLNSETPHQVIKLVREAGYVKSNINSYINHIEDIKTSILRELKKITDVDTTFIKNSYKVIIDKIYQSKIGVDAYKSIFSKFNENDTIDEIDITNFASIIEKNDKQKL